MAGKGNILIGISGGIAAYKSLSLIRLFVKAGYEVKVVVTKNALEFVTQLSIETLSKNKLYSDVFLSPEEYSTEHISITDFADVFVIAPATANILGKFVAGIADDALSTSFLAFDKPVFIAPAMNSKMYTHFSVQKNIEVLKNHGVHFIEPTFGDLVCGYQGNGRMEEPEAIFDFVDNFLHKSASLNGKKALISAGPTVEAIDPVRFISNHSSGKMGVAIAHELLNRGAEVTLVCGPIEVPISSAIHRINVLSAQQMYDECISLQKSHDVIVMAAAVADYAPVEFSETKIKKNSEDYTIVLKKTKDILKDLGENKANNQLIVGFALETDHEMENAFNKLSSKHLDFLVLNSLNDYGAGFGLDTNKITIIDKDKSVTQFSLKTKKEVATDIVNYIEQKLK
ncbi:MAG: bifunctional phosphopantothenoylcysteine decarboxylase/phosphopantothenate--cysteine ligase CoaBC [Bacteroidota bacterium]